MGRKNRVDPNQIEFEDEHWEEWDEWGEEHPKAGGRKKARTRLKSKDREKPEEVWIEPSIQGLVVSIGSKRCLVRHSSSSQDAEETECVLVEQVAENQRSNLAVGDQVRFWRRHQGPPGVREVLPRKNQLSRPDPLNPRTQRLIVANVDRVVHVISLAEPGFRAGLIDRIWIAVQKGGSGHLLFVNKYDLFEELEPEEQTRVETVLAYHRENGMVILQGSAEDNVGIDALRQELKGQRVVFVGHSGVGKSSLLNSLNPNLDLATQEVKESSGTGRHTTTSSEIYFLKQGLEIIDTPGVRQFGLWGLSKRELREIFPEFQRQDIQCQFSDCSHFHEPGCGVLQAVEDGRIPEVRYQTYKELAQSIDEASS